jgi:putative DNA methylase
LTYRKKLIEVALPLDAINKESARENYIYKGNPSAVHKWWAQRPLATCRAVLFASLVDDPSEYPDKFATEESQVRERERLFRIIEELVKWESSNDEAVLSQARAEIAKHAKGELPPIIDPFCGGGSIPLEAQRLGLKAYGSDLNPIPVLITKALVELPPKYAGLPPVNPEAAKSFGHSGEWPGTRGLAEDVRLYGKQLRNDAERRIGHLYPSGSNSEPVIAWRWARTVKCPNPICGAQMPLISSFWLSTKTGRKAWVEPVVNTKVKSVRFEVRRGDGSAPQPPKIGRGAKFRCLICQQVAEEQYIKSEGAAGRMRAQLMAVVVQEQRRRAYQSPTREQEDVAAQAEPRWEPEEDLPHDPRNVWCALYGLTKHGDLFTPRQLTAMNTLVDLIGEVHGEVRRDFIASRSSNAESSTTPLDEEADAYAGAVVTYLAFACSKVAAYGNSLVPWYTKEDRPSWLFGRQTIPMVWDYAEVNPFSDIGGGLAKSVSVVADSIATLAGSVPGAVSQGDAAQALPATRGIICTDPPYYDNVPYANLSDFFYVWLRRMLRKMYPNLLSTVLVPKEQELVADPYRHNGKEGAQYFFEKGLTKSFALMREVQEVEYPLTIFYAFKQEETERHGQGDGTSPTVASTGWQTMLEGLLQAGFAVTGTWPMRTEREQGLKAGANVLASSIVLVCRPRPSEAPPATRQEFVRALRRELPNALSVMMAENIAPVDLAQATIGPGMAIYSRYSKVVEADGLPMRVRTALQIINQSLDEHLTAAEGDVDSHSRFALTWFEQRGMESGPYGEAESIATARNVAVRGVVDAGILEARAGKVQLLPREKLLERWDPQSDGRLTDWEIVQYLIRALEAKGEQGAATLLARIGERGEAARDLAYRLYGICERKKWAEEALSYNALVVAWPEITRLASQNPGGVEPQTTMDF